MSEIKPTPSGDPSDPLSNLHRMSTTAGVASSDYVAVNLIAVAAVVLGLASALVLLSDVLLVVPLAAVICGIVAFRQIHNSNGTQTGRGLALLGMLVAIGFGAFIGIRALKEYNVRTAEQASIQQVVDQLQTKIKAQDFKGTLPLFVDSFLSKKKLTEDAFADIWRRSTVSASYGAVKSVGITRVVVAQAGEGEQAAGSMLVITFEKIDQPLRREILFRKTANQWKIDDIPIIFPAPPPQPPPAQGGAGPGMLPPM